MRIINYCSCICLYTMVHEVFVNYLNIKYLIWYFKINRKREYFSSFNTIQGNKSFHNHINIPSILFQNRKYDEGCFEDRAVDKREDILTFNANHIRMNAGPWRECQQLCVMQGIKFDFEPEIFEFQILHE